MVLFLQDDDSNAPSRLDQYGKDHHLTLLELERAYADYCVLSSTGKKREAREVQAEAGTEAPAGTANSPLAPEEKPIKEPPSNLKFSLPTSLSSSVLEIDFNSFLVRS